MQLVRTPLSDVLVFEPDVFEDDRGYFMETWNERTFREHGLDLRFVQDNQSHSVQGVLRGLHYQVRLPQGKLVRATRGEIFDVAVDLRRRSGCFGRWYGTVLSEDNHRMMWIPPGFAHGFYVTRGPADCVYKCTELYAPEHERTLKWNDPEIGISWPLAEGTEPVLSPKDARGLALSEAEAFEGDT